VPSMVHQSSAPGVLEHPMPRKKLSAERMSDKRRSIEKKRRDSAESGDDEDEELGHVQARAKSPRVTGRARGSSKLGTEMMRTNSRGSVVSVDDITTATDILPSSPPPVISEESYLEASPGIDAKISLTPPEMFPRLPGASIEEIDMDAPEAATPKPIHPAESPDPDPTPRPLIAFEKGPTPAEGSLSRSP